MTTPRLTRTDFATWLLPSFSSPLLDATCFPPLCCEEVSSTFSCTESLDLAEVLTAADVAETDATALLPDTDDTVADAAAEEPVTVPLILTVPLMADAGGT